MYAEFTRPGHGDLASRLILGTIGIIMWHIGVNSLITKSPDPPSRICTYVRSASKESATKYCRYEYRCNH